MSEIATIKQRILQYLDYKGVSKYECYQKTGITNGVLSKKEGLSEDNLLRFVSYYIDVDHTWLLTGQGDMLRAINNKKTPDTIIYRDNPDKDEIISLQRSKIELLEDKISELKKELTMSQNIAQNDTPSLDVVSTLDIFKPRKRHD